MRVVSLRTDHGSRPALVRQVKGGAYHALMMNQGAAGCLGVARVPQTDERYMTDLEYRGRPYPVKRALTTFARYGRNVGATKAAKQFLKLAREYTK